MRDLIIEKVKRHWDDKIAMVMDRELDEVLALNDLDLLEVYTELLEMGMGRGESRLIKENKRMQEELRRLYGVERPFICGDVGDTDEYGMREYYLVCPMYGADGFALYKKHKEYSAPGY
jgi:hypothetical protein